MTTAGAHVPHMVALQKGSYPNSPQSEVVGSHPKWDAWLADNSTMAAGLKMITWDSTRELTGGTVRAAQLWHRIKLRTYSTWDTHRQIPGCPLLECQAVYVAYSHQWWECAAAQSLWEVFYQWQRLGLSTQDVTLTEVFGVHLPYVPTTIWTNVATFLAI